jgi:ribonuclease-3 family protein
LKNSRNLQNVSYAGKERAKKPAVQAGIKMEEELKMTTEFCTLLLESFGKEKQNTNLLSPLNLAYVGDAIYEVIIRTVILEEGNAPVNKLNAKARNFVKAESQALFMHKLVEDGALTEQEESIYRRGRNAKSYTSAKNASLSDYRTATGFEALMGYLYLEGQTKRMLELILRAVELAGMEL